MAEVLAQPPSASKPKAGNKAVSRFFMSETEEGVWLLSKVTNYMGEAGGKGRKSATLAQEILKSRQAMLLAQMPLPRGVVRALVT